MTSQLVVDYHKHSSTEQPTTNNVTDENSENPIYRRKL